VTKHNRVPLAAIDLGTNSFHLIVVRANTKTGRFSILDREKEIVRLGSGTTDMKHIPMSAMNRGVETLMRFRIIADSFKAPIRAIATSAVREALNRDEFIRRVKTETGIGVEIASGVEEARLVYLGALQALPVFDKKVLLIDIGGGSTEFLIGQRRRITYDNSLKIGAVRLTSRFFPSGKYSKKAVKAAREFVRLLLAPVERSLGDRLYDVAVGTSGTMTTIARMVRAATHKRNLQAPINGFSFTREEAHGIVGAILDAKSTKELSELPGLEKERADIIVAGALILDEIARVLRIKSITVSEYALREGIVLDTIEQRYRRRGVHTLDDIRYHSVLHLAESLGYEKEHCQHVASLALAIFDQLHPLHKLGPAAREYLEAASLLHDVGLFLSQSQHHRHSYYLIRNADLIGFTENEKEIIAQTARYHRKSHPKFKHVEFQSLSESDKTMVKSLASFLRIAEGLDRTHRQAIASLRCTATGKSVSMALRRDKLPSVSIELMGANFKKSLFEDVFNREVKFRATGRA
jgi:exopolyphosphatase/guanosine-5'-triphosphate,3'-diphosphate pyrophosphatase